MSSNRTIQQGVWQRKSTLHRNSLETCTTDVISPNEALLKANDQDSHAFKNCVIRDLLVSICLQIEARRVVEANNESREVPSSSRNLKPEDIVNNTVDSRISSNTSASQTRKGGDIDVQKSHLVDEENLRTPMITFKEDDKVQNTISSNEQDEEQTNVETVSTKCKEPEDGIICSVSKRNIVEGKRRRKIFVPYADHGHQSKKRRYSLQTKRCGKRRGRYKKQHRAMILRSSTNSRRGHRRSSKKQPIKEIHQLDILYKQTNTPVRKYRSDVEQVSSPNDIKLRRKEKYDEKEAIVEEIGFTQRTEDIFLSQPQEVLSPEPARTRWQDTKVIQSPATVLNLDARQSSKIARPNLKDTKYTKQKVQNRHESDTGYSSDFESMFRPRTKSSTVEEEISFIESVKQAKGRKNLVECTWMKWDLNRAAAKKSRLASLFEIFRNAKTQM